MVSGVCSLGSRMSTHEKIDGPQLESKPFFHLLQRCPDHLLLLLVAPTCPLCGTLPETFVLLFAADVESLQELQVLTQSETPETFVAELVRSLDQGEPIRGVRRTQTPKVCVVIHPLKVEAHLKQNL